MHKCIEIMLANHQPKVYRLEVMYIYQKTDIIEIYKKTKKKKNSFKDGSLKGFLGNKNCSYGINRILEPLFLRVYKVT